MSRRRCNIAVVVYRRATLRLLLLVPLPLLVYFVPTRLLPLPAGVNASNCLAASTKPTQPIFALDASRKDEPAMFENLQEIRQCWLWNFCKVMWNYVSTNATNANHKQLCPRTWNAPAKDHCHAIDFNLRKYWTESKSQTTRALQNGEDALWNTSIPAPAVRGNRTCNKQSQNHWETTW